MDRWFRRAICALDFPPVMAAIIAIAGVVRLPPTVTDFSEIVTRTADLILITVTFMLKEWLPLVLVLIAFYLAERTLTALKVASVIVLLAPLLGFFAPHAFDVSGSVSWASLFGGIMGVGWAFSFLVDRYRVSRRRDLPENLVSS